MICTGLFPINVPKSAKTQRKKICSRSPVLSHIFLHLHRFKLYNFLFVGLCTSTSFHLKHVQGPLFSVNLMKFKHALIHFYCVALTF